MSDKKMMVSDIAHTIYYGKYKEVEEGVFKCVGKKEDVTDEAIRSVFEWFMKNFQDNEPNEAFEVKFKGIPYILRMIKDKHT
jgi:hypothetical protein